MENFDRHKHWSNIYSEFRKTDEFYKTFCDEFVDELCGIVGLYHPEMIKSSEVESNLRLYAREMLSTIEAVKYKDESYSAHRLDEELQMMTRLVVKEAEAEQIPEFIDHVHEQAKAMLVRHFPDIIDLSGRGLRLLEKNSKMYNWEFITNFYLLYKK